MTPESKVKKKVKQLLDSMGAYHFSPMGTGYGHAGVPDIVGCYKGLFFGIECKAGKGMTTALQDKEIAKITDAGGLAMVINESTVDRVVPILILKAIK